MRRVTFGFSLVTVFSILLLVATNLHAQPSDFSRCDGLTGAAVGLCKAGIAAGCMGLGDDPEACTHIMDTYVNIVGDQPPWACNSVGTLCGGITHVPCGIGEICVDDPSDGCDPNNGGTDCGGLCSVGSGCIPLPEFSCTTNADCISSDFCFKPETGTCDSAGICRERPILCPLLYLPVLGCDGFVYDSPCEAQQAGTNILLYCSDGGCPTP